MRFGFTTTLISFGLDAKPNWSVATSWNRYVPASVGTNVGLRIVASDRVTDGPDCWVQA